MNATSSTLLRAVTPQGGRHAFWNLETKGTRWVDGDIFADAADTLAGRSDLYFALGAFASDSRLADNCTHLRAFWLDIDVREDKRTCYPTMDAAKVGLFSFLEATAAPTPTHVVTSGRGIHVYWALDDDVPAATWKPIASALKAACTQHNLLADAACTTDTARILRVPGTINGKNGEVVTLRKADGAVTLAQMAEAFPPRTAPAPKADSLGQRPEHVTALVVDMPTMSHAPRTFEDYLLDPTRCAHLQAAIDTGGAQDEEPLWRANLSVVQACTADTPSARRKFIALVSSNHPGYDADAADAKAASTAGPYSCKQFDALRPGLCAACPRNGQITSPVQLVEAPRVIDEDTGAVTGPTEMVEVAARTTSDGMELSPLSFAIPAGYFVGRNGAMFRHLTPSEIEKQKAKEDGSITTVAYVCRAAFGIARRWKMPDSNIEAHTWVSQKDVAGTMRVSTCMVPSTELNDPKGRLTTLNKMGIYPAFDVKGTAERNETDTYMRACMVAADRLPQEAVRTHYGWQSDMADAEFALPEVTVRPGGGVHETMLSKVQAVQDGRGTLADWNTFLTKFYGAASSTHHLAIAAGFASPLYSAQPGMAGGMISLYSPGSGTGKTTLLNTISRIYGGPEDLVISGTSTLSGITLKLRALHSVPTMIDEITEAPNIPGLLYAITQGKTKDAAKTDGTAREGGTWKSFCLTSTNASVFDAVKPIGKSLGTDALAQRAVEMTIPPMEGGVGTEYIEDATVQGVAGRAWVRYIQTHRLMMIAEMRAEQSRLRAKFPVPAEGVAARFRCAMLASCIVAARHAQLAGVFPFDPEAVRIAAEATLDTGTARIEEDHVEPAQHFGDLLSEMSRHTITVGQGVTADTHLTTLSGMTLVRVDRVKGFALIAKAAIKHTKHPEEWGALARHLNTEYNIKGVAAMRAGATRVKAWRIPLDSSMFRGTTTPQGEDDGSD